jgi:KipI family sensor histidine kinase inhibitor
VAEAGVSALARRDVRDGIFLVEYPGWTDDEANRAAVSLSRRLRDAGERGLLDAVPGARTVLVVFDPDRNDVGRLGRLVDDLGTRAGDRPSESRRLRIPVVYDGEDLADLAGRLQVPAEEIARRHAAGRYRVAFIGFAPGFAYLSGLPPELATARLATPRQRVPAGSLAIGGSWTGIYPAPSPGGWRLIGRTSARLYDPRATSPSLLAPGDQVEFERVEAAELAAPPAPTPPPEPEGRLVARVLSPGLWTTVQGAARYGLGSSGVPPGGAMDPASLALANALVDNPPGAPALEVTLAGPEVEFAAETVLAVAGGEVSADRNGAPAPFREAFRAAAGDRVRIGRITRGARAYLAVRGGVVGPSGRRLETGDVLAEGGSPPAPDRRLPEPVRLGDELPVRVMVGPETGQFVSGQLERFLSSPWRVTPESDRRGLRLSGEPLFHDGPPEIAPAGTVPGSIQVPGSGLPIVLGPDGPVTGGYPRIAAVISADLSLLGQARPGGVLRFERVSLAEAHAARGARGSTIGLP